MGSRIVFPCGFVLTHAAELTSVVEYARPADLMNGKTNIPYLTQGP